MQIFSANRLRGKILEIKNKENLVLQISTKFIQGEKQATSQVCNW